MTRLNVSAIAGIGCLAATRLVRAPTASEPKASALPTITLLSENQMRISRRTLTPMVIVIACVLCFSIAEAKKPGGKPAYSTIDLLGFDNGDLGYQSQAWFVSERDATGGVAILGSAFERYPAAPYRDEFNALWNVDGNGTFLEPLNLGHPPHATGNIYLGTGGANNLGEFVGDGFLYAPGQSYLPLPPGNTTARDINDLGQIVGSYPVDPDEYDGRNSVGGLWQLHADGTLSDPQFLDFFYPVVINNYGVMAGSLYGDLAIAWLEAGELQVQFANATGGVAAINDYPIGDPRLTVVGTDSNYGHAWRPFDNATPITVLGNLGAGGSTALDVNNHGQIVGYADTKSQGQQAFLYTGETMLNLNSQVERSSRKLQWATSINDDGDIVGFMRIPRPVSEVRAFLLRPNVSN